MRIDRIVTLGLVRPLTRTHSLERDTHLPVLMYHSISDEMEVSSGAYYRVCTAPGRFAENMRWLAEKGWQGITVNQGLDFLAGKLRVTGRPVVITFDDGFRNFYTSAFPSLRHHGFSATMYLPTKYIGTVPLEFKGRECLTWKEVAVLADAGIEFGSHTVTHPKLVDLSWPDIDRELHDSRACIQDRLGVSVHSFAYPFAFPQGKPAFVDRLTESLRTIGFTNCVTTEVGRHKKATDPYRIKRLPVNNDDDLDLFMAKLDGAYDWLGWPQALVKRIRRR